MNQHVPSGGLHASDPGGPSAEIRDMETIQFVTFYFGDHLFGLPIDQVIEINRLLEVTPVPLAPQYVAGVVNLRGQILTSVHLARRIGLRFEGERGGQNNVIMGRGEEPISLLVERIGDVISVPKDQIEPPPVLIEGMDVDFVRQVCKLANRLLIVLDAEALERFRPIERSGLAEQA